MKLNFVDAAKMYVGNLPSPWISLVQNVLDQFFTWMGEELFLDKHESSQLKQASFSGEIYAFLLDPHSVQKFAAYEDNDSVVAAILGGIKTILARSKARCYEHEGPLYNEANDKWRWHDGGLSSHMLIEDEEEAVSSGLWAGFPIRLLQSSIEDFELNTSSLEFQLQPVPENKQPSQSSAIFRLDVIDLALYKALLKQPELMRTLDWRTFEKLLADVLASLEYDVELQRGTKDGGVDIFAVKKDTAFGIQRYLIQAKRWANKVGIEPVRQLVFLQSHFHVTKACLATTATFTRGAWELAEQYRWQLELRDFDGLHEWIHLAAHRKGH